MCCMGGYWSKNTCSKLLRSMLYLGLQICFANQWIDFYVIPIAFCFNSDINKFPFFINFHRFFICKIILTKLLLAQINIHQKVFGKIDFFKVSCSLNKQFLWSMCCDTPTESLHILSWFCFKHPDSCSKLRFVL